MDPTSCCLLGLMIVVHHSWVHSHALNPASFLSAMLVVQLLDELE